MALRDIRRSLAISVLADHLERALPEGGTIFSFERAIDRIPDQRGDRDSALRSEPTEAFGLRFGELDLGAHHATMITLDVLADYTSATAVPAIRQRAVPPTEYSSTRKSTLTTDVPPDDR